MREHIPGCGSAAVAVVACLLVVCSALAVAPGTASAAHVDGEISYSESDGELTVTVDVRNASDGGFTGGEENVTIRIGGEPVPTSPTTPGENESTYTYTVDKNSLSEASALDNRSSVSVAVFHDNQNDDSFNRTVRIRHLALRSGGGFDNGELRLRVGTNFGVTDGDTVPLELEASDEAETTATYDASDSSLVVSRDTLNSLGTFENPQQITVSGGAPYVRGEVQANPRNQASTTGERASDNTVRFENPLFGDGQTYAVNVSTGDAQYLRDVSAGDQTIEINSRAVAAESSMTLSVSHDGNTIVDGETLEFPNQPVSANETGLGVRFDDLPDRVETGNVTVWAETSSGFERYDARLNSSNGTLTLRGAESLPSPENANQTALLLQFGDGAPLSATVTLQQVDGNTSAAEDDGSQGESGLPWSTILLAVIVMLGIIVVALVVFLALQKLGPGNITLNLGLFGSSDGSSPGTSPGVETADVSLEVVDEVAGKTYPHVTEVIARPRNQGRSSGSRQGTGNSSGRTAGGAGLQGVNTDDTETIDLTAGEGDVELGYGDWVFEARQNGETVGQRRHTLNYGYESDHIALSVDPYVVEATVTGGPDREPLRGATVEATADAGGWKRRQPTDGKGRGEFEVPRSASTVSFTATHGNLPPAESQCRVEQAVRNGVTLAIADGAGTMRVETTVGDVSWPGVEVKLTPVSEQAKTYADEGTFAVNDDGHQRVENLPAGEYELSAHPQLEAVDTTAAVERVTVGDGDTANVTLSIGVSYRISTTERERLTELRDRIDGLASAPDRDVAIPRYYGTVLTSVLEVVEDVESAPERAVETGFSPDETVEALLDATEAGITAVDAAMSERRNVSLFDACESMPPARADWNGAATLDAFLSRVNEGSDHERRALSDRLRAADEVLDQQWGEVNEIAPARKLHDRIGELARETGNVGDELTAVAQAYVGICLLDAVEGIFDHDALVDRLNSGSY